MIISNTQILYIYINLINEVKLYKSIIYLYIYIYIYT